MEYNSGTTYVNNFKTGQAEDDLKLREQFLPNCTTQKPITGTT